MSKTVFSKFSFKKASRILAVLALAVTIGAPFSMFRYSSIPSITGAAQATDTSVVGNTSTQQVATGLSKSSTSSSDGLDSTDSGNKFESDTETVKLDQGKQLNIPTNNSKFGEIKIDIPKDTIIKAKTPIINDQKPDQNIFAETAAKLMSFVGVASNSSSKSAVKLPEFKEESITADKSPEVKSDKSLGDSVNFEFGDPTKHLTFSSPVQVIIPVNVPDYTYYDIKVKHVGDDKFGYIGLTSDATIGCDDKGEVLSKVQESVSLAATDGKVIFYTCGASDFSLTSSAFIRLESVYPTGGGKITSNLPTISGNALTSDPSNTSGQNNFPAGAVVNLTLNGSPAIIGSATVANNGKWSIVPTSPLPDGLNKVCGNFYSDFIYLASGVSRIDKGCIEFSVNTQTFGGRLTPSQIDYNQAQSTPIIFDAIFDKPIIESSFDINDITLTGTATSKSIVSITEVAPFDKTRYTVVGQATDSGTINAQIAKRAYTYTKFDYTGTIQSPTNSVNGTITIPNGEKYTIKKTNVVGSNAGLGSYDATSLIHTLVDGTSNEISFPDKCLDTIILDSLGSIYVAYTNIQQVFTSRYCNPAGLPVVNPGIIQVTPNFTGIYSTDNYVNETLVNGDGDLTGIVGTTFPVIPFGNANTLIYENQNATLKIPNTAGGFSNVTGKIVYNSFIPDGTQAIPLNSKTSFQKARISVGNIEVKIDLNFSPVGTTNLLGKQNIILNYLTVEDNYTPNIIGFRAGTINLLNTSLPAGTRGKLTVTNYSNGSEITKTFVGSIQIFTSPVTSKAFVPDNDQITDNTFLGKYVGKLSVVGATTGVLLNFKSFSQTTAPAIIAPSVSTAIGGAAGSPFPSFPLGGTTLVNGDILTLAIPGSTTIVSGFYSAGNFVPNPGTIIPLDVTNVTSGFLYGQLRFYSQSITIATNFTNTNPCGTSQGGGGVEDVTGFIPNIFGSIDVLAQSGATISASDCGVIYTPTIVTISVPALTNNPRPPITGTCVTGDNLTVVVTPTNQTFANISCVNSIYTITPTVTIPDGAYCGNVVAINPASIITTSFSTASAQSCGVIDTATYITVSVPQVNYDPRPTLTGTCEVGGTVTLTVTNGIQSTNILQVLTPFTCGANGTYSVVTTSDIPRGSYCGNAYIVDSLGNTATATPSCGRIDLGQFLTILVPATSTNPKPTITGTCEMGNAVTVSITNGTPSTNVLQTLPQFTCPASETYSIVPPTNIPDGTYCGNAIAVDTLTAGGGGAPTSFTAIPSCGIIDATTYITVSVPAVSNNPRPTITGTCEPGGTVTIDIGIRINQGPQSVVAYVNSLPVFTCSATGTYTVNPQFNIPSNEYCATAKIVDVSGNIANGQSCGSINLTTTVSISVPSLTNNPKPTITGTCVSGNTLTVIITPTNETRANISCPSNGIYTLTPNTAIPDGNYCASVSASGTGGGGPVLSYLDIIYNIFGTITVSAQSATAGPSCGVIDTKTIITTSIPNPAITSTPTITGTCETGAIVSLNITFGNPSQAGQVLTPFTCVGGEYSVPTTTPILDGQYCANASAVETLVGTNPAMTNSAGPVQSCGIIDTSTFITVTVPPVTSNPTPTINGTCEPLGIITIKITNGEVSATNPNPTTTTIQTLPNFTCTNTGTYSVVPTADIPNGPYCAIGSIVDVAGNTASSAASCGIVDTSTFVTVSVPELTNSHFPIITGTCEVGSSLQITINPTGEIQSTNCGATINPTAGTYTVTPAVSIPNGAYSAATKATDGAGNIANATDNGVIDDTILVTVSVPSLTNNPKPPITGDCKTGATVTLVVTYGAGSTPTSPLVSALSPAIPPFTCVGVSYSVNPGSNIPDGPYCATATSLDVVGNSAGPVKSCGTINSSTTVAIDSPPPVINDNTPTITGTCETGGVVTVVISNTIAGNPNTLQTLGNVPCNLGTYTVTTTTPIPDGPFCVNASILETLSGTNPVLTNSASASPQKCSVVDTSTYITTTVPPVSPDPKPRITGTCEAGGVVTITITTGNPSTNVIQTLPNFTCDNTNTYSVIPANNIPDGPYCTNGRIVDIAGNTASSIAGCGTVDNGTYVTIVVPALGTNNLPSFTGTCETGASLVLTITPTNEVITGVTCVAGAYSIPATVFIPTGNYCGSIKATDSLGNTANATGCGDILVTVEVPVSTTNKKPVISGSCTPSISGGYQVPVEVTIRFGAGSNTGAGTVSEVINTTCSTAGKYTVTPTKEIPIGLYAAVAKATSDIGNIAINTSSGTITVAIPDPEIFSFISDPYQCGQAITGKVASNYGIEEIIVNLFAKKTDGSGGFESSSRYTFRPIADTSGNYAINLNYKDEAVFAKGEYKVEFSVRSKNQATKAGSYTANITDNCNPLALITTTVRTGGFDRLILILLPLFAGLAYYGYNKSKKLN
jgi:hypothetical protein